MTARDALRRRLEDQVERLLQLLDALDGDADAEPEPDEDNGDTEDELAPVTLQRGLEWELAPRHGRHA